MPASRRSQASRRYNDGCQLRFNGSGLSLTLKSGRALLLTRIVEPSSSNQNWIPICTFFLSASECMATSIAAACFKPSYPACKSWAPISPTNQKKRADFFRGPPVPATLEGGKNQSGNPAVLAGTDALRVPGRWPAPPGQPHVVTDRDGVPPRGPVRQDPKHSSLRLIPDDEMAANEGGLRCGQ